jgi:metalloendopeptidase OMA1, mitochondrial
LKFILILVLSFAMLILPSCAGKPSTKGINESDINAEAAKAYAEIKAKSKISQNKEWTAMVQRVASRIAAYARGKNCCLHGDYARS